MGGDKPARRRREVAYGLVAAAGAALFLIAPGESGSGFVGRLGAAGRAPVALCRSYDSDTVTELAGWRVRRSDPRQRKRRERGELTAEVPFPREQCEVMVDAMSVIKHFREKEKVNDYGMVIEDDPHSFWPARIYAALRPIVRHYGRDRPPSPWDPVMCVYDIPNPSKTKSGLKVRKWGNLHKQGPRSVGRGKCGERGEQMTIAFAQTYVDQSAAERYRCDKEILWMLEVLTREYPRRQILVTGDKWLQREAKRYAMVRDVDWLEQEILREGEAGEKALAPLKGESNDIPWSLEGLPANVKRAFTVY